MAGLTISAMQAIKVVDAPVSFIHNALPSILKKTANGTTTTIHEADDLRKIRSSTFLN